VAVRTADLQPHRLRAATEVVHRDERRVAPVVPEHEDFWRVRAQHRELTPSDLRTLLARTNQPFRPVEERFRIAALRGDVDGSVAVLAIINRGPNDSLRA